MRMLVVVALLVFGACSKPVKPVGTLTKPPHVAAIPTTPAGELKEYFVWEKIGGDKQQLRFKQVNKNYFLDDALCQNVIDVLANPPLPPRETTYSDFECWPASMNPNEYYGKYSSNSDVPPDVLLARREQPPSRKTAGVPPN